jgi:hypothetical protein
MWDSLNKSDSRSKNFDADFGNIEVATENATFPREDNDNDGDDYEPPAEEEVNRRPKWESEDRRQGAGRGFKKS